MIAGNIQGALPLGWSRQMSLSAVFMVMPKVTLDRTVGCFCIEEDRAIHVLINDRSILNIAWVSNLIIGHSSQSVRTFSRWASLTRHLSCVVEPDILWAIRINSLDYCRHMETQENSLMDHTKNTIKTVGNRNFLAPWDSCVVMVEYLAHWRQTCRYKQPDCLYSQQCLMIFQMLRDGYGVPVVREAALAQEKVKISMFTSWKQVLSGLLHSPPKKV